MNDSNVIRDREEGIVPFLIFLHVFPLCYTFCNCPKVLGFLFCLSDSLTVSTSILESCIVISQGLLILSSHISTVLIISLKELLISVLLLFFIFLVFPIWIFLRVSISADITPLFLHIVHYFY